MKTVPIDVLKRRLSSTIAKAAAGERIVITKHGRPVAALGPADLEHVHVGTRVGRARLVPAIRGGTDGEALRTLLDDRGHDRLDTLLHARRDRKR